MAEKGSKKKKAKRTQPNVLGNLSATRPTRIGARRERSPEAKAASREASARPREATPAGNGATRRRKTTADTPTPRATTTAADQPAPAQAAGGGRPRAVTPGSPPLEARHRPGEERPAVTPPHGAELVTTAIQAVGEVAQVGLTVGGQMLKRAVQRLPKP